jgi:hypothetical protein
MTVVVGFAFRVVDESIEAFAEMGQEMSQLSPGMRIQLRSRATGKYLRCVSCAWGGTGRSW